MDKAKLNLAIDLLMLLFVLILIGTGFLLSPLSFRFGIRVRGPLIVQAHDISSLIFSILLAAHLYLHLDWFRCMLFKKKKR